MMKWLSPLTSRDLAHLDDPSEIVETPPRYRFQIGTVRHSSGVEEFDIDENQLATHSCVLGATGSGKSKYLELLMRYLMSSNQGFALIDPHGDLSEDLLAFAGYRKLAKRDKSICDRIHYLEPSFDQVFCFDPFRFRPVQAIPTELETNAYQSWLRAKADRVAEIFQRKQNQANFEGMPRLQRVLTNVLIAVGTTIDPLRNRHLPLSDALVLLDVNHPRNAEVMARVRPKLEPEIAADFDRLKKLEKQDEQRLRETESTINRLRSLLSPIVKSIFSQQVESIDFRSIVQNGEILLVNLRETDYFSADQKTAIGGLFIHELLSTARNEPRQSRKPFHLIIDEAADFIADDVHQALGVMRKFQMPICLAAQDLSSFKKGDLDLRPKVLSQCGTIVSFRQSWPEDTECLARVLGTGNLDFRKHFQIVDRPDGYDWIDLEERGTSTSRSTNRSTTETASASKTRGQSESTNRSFSENESSSDNYSTSNNRSRTQSESFGENESVSKGTSESRGRSSGESVDHNKRVSKSSSWSEGSTESNSKSIGTSNTRGTSDTTGHSESVGHSDSRGISNSRGRTQGTSEAETIGHSEGKTTGYSSTEGESRSYRKVPLARHREEQHEAPSLQNSISDQLEFIRHRLVSLGIGEAIVKTRDEREAVVMKTVMVDEKWQKKDKFAAIERMKELCRQKPYFTVPNLAPDAMENRLTKFLEDNSHSNGSHSGNGKSKNNGNPDPFGA